MKSATRRFIAHYTYPLPIIFGFCLGVRCKQRTSQSYPWVTSGMQHLPWWYGKVKEHAIDPKDESLYVVQLHSLNHPIDSETVNLLSAWSRQSQDTKSGDINLFDVLNFVLQRIEVDGRAKTWEHFRQNHILGRNYSESALVVYWLKQVLATIKVALKDSSSTFYRDFFWINKWEW